MADFTKAIKIILHHEGGYVNDPKDPGGETNFGISKRAFPSVDIRNLTIERATQIYKTNYWEKILGDEIIQQELATNIFDFAVNAGVSQAVKRIQRIVDVTADGIAGARTIERINSSKENLNVLFTSARIDFYKSLIVKQPSSSKFFNGWKKRSLSFLKHEEVVLCQ